MNDDDEGWVEIPATCSKCGVTHQRGAPEQEKSGYYGFRCPSCAHLEWVHFVSDFDQRESVGTDREWVVVIRWSGPLPSEGEIAATEALLSELGDHPHTQALGPTAVHEFVVGIFPRPKADEIAQRGRALGLSVGVL